MFVEVPFFGRQSLAYRMLLSVDQSLEFEGLAHSFEVYHAVFILMMVMAVVTAMTVALALVLIKNCHSVIKCI